MPWPWRRGAKGARRAAQNWGALRSFRRGCSDCANGVWQRSQRRAGPPAPGLHRNWPVGSAQHSHASTPCALPFASSATCRNIRSGIKRAGAASTASPAQASSRVRKLQGAIPTRGEYAISDMLRYHVGRQAGPRGPLRAGPSQAWACSPSAARLPGLFVVSRTSAQKCRAAGTSVQ